MRTVGQTVDVGITSTRIFYCRAIDINTLTIRAVGALTIGLAGGGVNDGIPLTAGEAVSFSKQDFPDCGPTELLEVYAVAAAPTTANIFGFMRS